MKRLALAFAAGVSFTLGLAFSGMTQPRKVRGFLDVSGAWDASLSLVMLGAVVVYALIFWSSRGRSAPWCGGSFQLPTTSAIDLRLLAGALPDSWFERALHDAAWLAAFDLEDASPLRWVRQSRARQLLIHGTADSQVPLRHSLALSSLAGPLAELRSIPGAEHYDLPQGVLESEALAWFERWLPPLSAEQGSRAPESARRPRQSCAGAVAPLH